MSKAKSEISRRGFLGTLGAVGAAAAIPLSWNRSEPTDVHVDTVHPNLSEYGEDCNPTPWAEEEYTLEGTWDSTPGHAIKGLNPQIEIDGTKFDLHNYSMDYSANITEDYAFDTGPFAIKGLSELEVECSFIGEQRLVETMKWDTKTRHVVIDTGDHKFEFDAYPKGVVHEYPPNGFEAADGFLSSVTFIATGEVKRCLK